MTAVQIARVALAADRGVSTTRLAQAVAIALAESGGFPGAGNHYTSGGVKHRVYGLWQISDIHGTGSGPCDPAAGAAAMWSLSGQGADWRAWSAFGGARYLGYLPAARTAAAKVRGEAPGGIGGTASVGTQTNLPGPVSFLVALGLIPVTGAQKGIEAVSSIPKLAGALVWAIGWFFSGGALRVGMTIAGAILVLIGIALVFAHSKIGETVRSVAPTALAKA